MLFPIVIHKDADSDYGVTVPDLPGCFSAGSSIEDAILMATEAVQGHLGVLVDSGEPMPVAKPIEIHRKNPDYKGAVLWSVVDVDLTKFQQVERINVTIPRYVLQKIDSYAQKRGVSRSQLLAEGALTLVENSGNPGRMNIRKIKERKIQKQKKMRH